MSENTYLPWSIFHLLGDTFLYTKIQYLTTQFQSIIDDTFSLQKSYPEYLHLQWKIVFKAFLAISFQNIL